jgi:hypothetical protein
MNKIDYDYADDCEVNSNSPFIQDPHQVPPDVLEGILTGAFIGRVVKSDVSGGNLFIEGFSYDPEIRFGITLKLPDGIEDPISGFWYYRKSARAIMRWNGIEPPHSGGLCLIIDGNPTWEDMANALTGSPVGSTNGWYRTARDGVSGIVVDGFQVDKSGRFEAFLEVPDFWHEMENISRFTWRGAKAILEYNGVKIPKEFRDI